MTTPRTLTLLGPQRTEPRVRAAVSRLGSKKSIALIAAGWEEREPEHGELEEHLGQRIRNLEPYKRGEDVFAADPELFKGMQERHDQLRGLQDRYRLRLSHALAATRGLFEMHLKDPAGERDLEAALEAVRVLDESHLDHVVEIQTRFEKRFKLAERRSIARHRKELQALLAESDVVCIAGGHVAILQNRMRMFGLMDLIGDRSVIAWAGGAMVLSERVILFHDTPPQGAGDAEAFDRGFGLARGIVCLPHASKRLLLDDRARVALMARRFAPAACVTLDPPAEIDATPTGWKELGHTKQLMMDGTLAAMSEPVGAA